LAVAGVAGDAAASTRTLDRVQPTDIIGKLLDVPEPVNARLRGLPAVERLVGAASGVTDLPRWSLVEAARIVLARTREALLAGPDPAVPDLRTLAGSVADEARRICRPFPRRVLNATGVVVHTNLGRAPLAPEAAEAVARAAVGYSDLELDLASGERGSRLTVVSQRLCQLSGAQAALVVNNNAAAVLLAVDALAAGREVILSRGELVEIGGSFRVPEILASSRARLREIGTTNRTHPDDYARAIGPDTGILLKVHRSNFEVRGFVAEVSLAELAAIGRARGVPVVEDRGSGTLLDLRPHGIPEPEAWSGLRDGADLVLFSGDKLLGGPQAGIALGRRDLVERMRKSPLARALRTDKLTLAALDWTLRALQDGSAPERIPVLRMLLAPESEVRARAERLADALARQGWKTSVEAQRALVGGGALPDFELPGAAVRLAPRGSAEALAAALRRSEPPVIARIHKGALLLDPRTLDERDMGAVVAAFAALAD
jgi:L-seryl-tRNA(Ser) seleniumtransferase